MSKNFNPANHPRDERKGTSTGGQFVTRSRNESEVSLNEADVAAHYASLHKQDDGSVRDYVADHLGPGTRHNVDVLTEEYTRELSKVAEDHGMRLVGAQFRGPEGLQIDGEQLVDDAQKAWERAWVSAHRRAPVPDEVDLLEEELGWDNITAAFDKSLDAALQAQAGEDPVTTGDAADRLLTDRGHEVLEDRLDRELKSLRKPKGS